ncbi:type VII toxin-antitoxin system HepT family RNase toxin [Symbiopectobacterium purcellii]|uniref:DUF86 domain-containing protein n=1 Tax=Symbiopectobacterium purcellii TaxID=2871826 RepID=A0ABX9API3_9ENTR|nr:DUF86 domain-containing protein [Symbiopectobacterium purcellii]QZN97063.1 DUF86 domain-containing protein [Symbiopectobacterium purcellii]
MTDIIINKSAAIRHCLQRIREEFNQDAEHIATDFTRQDSVILNLLRACEAAIDLANHTIRVNQLGIPQSSRDSFALLAKNRIITTELAEKLQKMVGLRNIAVHDYQTLNLDIVIHVVQHHLIDFEAFIKQLAG